MVLRVPVYTARAVKGHGTGIPGADAGDSYPAAVCLMHAPLLDIPLPPHMQLLLLPAMYFFVHVQVLEYDHIRSVCPGKFRDRPGHLPGQFFVQPLCIGPAAGALSAPVFPLESPDPAQRMVKMVFFTWEVNELPGKDSTISCAVREGPDAQWASFRTDRSGSGDLADAVRARSLRIS